MKTIRVSIVINIQGEWYEQKAKAYWRSLCKLRSSTQTYLLERLYNLLNKYELYRAEKHKEYLKTWPPHSIFCEKRCCQPAARTYMRKLKKELVWGADGHLR